MNSLWKTVQALVKPTRMQAGDAWHTLPSLFDQLAESVGWAGAGGGPSLQGSRPTIATGIVSLLCEIAADTAYEMRRLKQPTIFKPETRLQPCRCRVPYAPCERTITVQVRHIPSELLHIAAITNHEGTWVDLVAGWVAQAENLLGIHPSRPRWARGTACPDCGETTAPTVVDGEAARNAALGITWLPPDVEDGTWFVGSVQCGACGAVWERGADLDRLVDSIYYTGGTTWQSA